MYICLLVSGIRGGPDFSCIGFQIICFIRSHCMSYVACILQKGARFGEPVHDPKNQDENKGTHCEVRPFRPSFQVWNGSPETGPSGINVQISMLSTCRSYFLEDIIVQVVCIRHGGDQFYNLVIPCVFVGGSK